MSAKIINLKKIRDNQRRDKMIAALPQSAKNFIFRSLEQLAKNKK